MNNKIIISSYLDEKLREFIPKMLELQKEEYLIPDLDGIKIKKFYGEVDKNIISLYNFNGGVFQICSS